MADRELRRRRPSTVGPATRPADGATEPAAARARSADVFPFGVAFAALLLSRSLSATVNIVHDCDETYNYWEPLHFLVYGSGFQTWEYGADNALRSYLYLLLHGAVLWPASLLLGDGKLKFLGFYALRLALGALSAFTEAQLVQAVAASVAGRGSWIPGPRQGQHPPHGPKRGRETPPPRAPTTPGEEEQEGWEPAGDGDGVRIGWYSLLLLCFCPGPFLASTTFLPSTFSMYAVAWATARLLQGHPCSAVAVAAAGTLLGWPFAALAAGPLVLAAFALSGLVPVLVTGTVASLLTFAASIAADWLFYGRPQCSILNLVWYNVFGGGDSALYGVEGPLFYLRNGSLNFALALPLSLLFPLLWLLLPRGQRRPLLPTVVAAAGPVFLWLGFMSLQPHKEERFLYVVYPLVCVCAAAALSVLPPALANVLGVLPVPRGAKAAGRQLGKAAAALLLLLTLVLSCCRTAAVLRYYHAPMEIYRQLPQAPGESDNQEPVTVCTGSEWHRFPTSFFLPSPRHRLRFLDDGFGGLLPFPFNASMGGTRAAPPWFNRENRAAPGQFVESECVCQFLVELHPSTAIGEDGGVQRRGGTLTRGDDSETWEVIHDIPYLDAAHSSALYRALWIPGVSEHRVKFGSYRLLGRKAPCSSHKSSAVEEQD